MTTGFVGLKGDLQRVAQESLQLNRTEFNKLVERAASLAKVDDTIFVALAERAAFLEDAELASLIEGAASHNVSLGVFIAAVLVFADQADDKPEHDVEAKTSIDPTISMWERRSSETIDWAIKTLSKTASSLESAVADRRKCLVQVTKLERKINRTQERTSRILKRLTRETHESRARQ